MALMSPQIHTSSQALIEKQNQRIHNSALSNYKRDSGRPHHNPNDLTPKRSASFTGTSVRGSGGALGPLSALYARLSASNKQNKQEENNNSYVDHRSGESVKQRLGRGDAESNEV